MPLNSLNVKAGDILRISVWVMASNLVPDSAALYPVTWACGFTYGFFTSNDNNAGFNNVPGYPIDTQFKFPAVTAFGWTEYTLDIVVPADTTARALEIRLHPYSRFTGTVYFDDLNVSVIGTTTGVADNGGKGLPKTIELANNYPNPFNPSTVIRYAMPHDGLGSLIIYNLLGQRVRMLYEGTISAGHHEITWDGKDQLGNTVQTGVYFYRLESGSVSIVKKMLIVK